MGENIKDFYYSRKAEERIKGIAEKVTTNVIINDKLYIYTECIDKGRKPTMEDDDRVYLGFTDSSNIKYGSLGGIRKYVKYRDRDCCGVCQLCFSENCYEKYIEDVIE